METLVNSLKHGYTSCIGEVRFDSHERLEYIHRIPNGRERYDNPCRWVISGDGHGYTVAQYDLSLYLEEAIIYGGSYGGIDWMIGRDVYWVSPSEICISEREKFKMHMNVVGSQATSSGAYNVYLQGQENPEKIVNLLIVNDYIEKIQLIDRETDTQTIYKSSLDKISFMELEDKRAIYQVAYQMIASASPSKTVGPIDDKSIDELIRSTCYMEALGNLVWNQADMIDPWTAFKKVSTMDEGTKAAIRLVLLNVARIDNTTTRLDILSQLCSPSKCNITMDKPKTMPSIRFQ